MSDSDNVKERQDSSAEPHYEGRDSYDMDIDRMVNEGLGGGQVTLHNGLVAESTTDTMEAKLEGE
ncbi:hypothetical protein [Paenibacillus paeoniae]|uniref:Uncharacterized protein n=1 Tax=Paenibacillus paeoniae TaxID=2292705 RepID=A0A371PFJ6_9BACL|nr:hypothetical protein [Paenibacillus paeoniae]REK74655.1 hypothetical protein DX130_13310 [Paenibacillus paeoniae]